MRTSIYLNNTQLSKAFEFFDRDKSGYISRSELKSVFETFHDIFSIFDTDDYNAIIAQADLNHDGKISYEEFVTFVCQDLNDCGNFII